MKPWSKAEDERRRRQKTMGTIAALIVVAVMFLLFFILTRHHESEDTDAAIDLESFETEELDLSPPVATDARIADVPANLPKPRKIEPKTTLPLSEAPSPGATKAPVEEPDDTTTSRRVDQRGALEVRVLRSGSRSVAGASVLVEPIDGVDPWFWYRTALTDKSGLCVFEGLPAVTYKITVAGCGEVRRELIPDDTTKVEIAAPEDTLLRLRSHIKMQEGDTSRFPRVPERTSYWWVPTDIVSTDESFPMSALGYFLGEISGRGVLEYPLEMKDGVIISRAPTLLASAPVSSRSNNGIGRRSMALQFLTRLELSPGALQLKGTVRRSDGRLASDALVVLGMSSIHHRAPWRVGWKSGNPLPYVTRTDRYGDFAFDDVEPGTVPISIIHEDAAIHHDEVSITDAETQPVEIRMKPSCAITGIVRWGKKRRCSSAVVRIESPKRSLKAASDGSFRFDGLPIDPIEISATAPGAHGFDDRVGAYGGQTIEWNAGLGGSPDLR